MDPPLDGGDGSPNEDSAVSSFSRHVSRVTDRFAALLPFAVVPFGLSVFDIERLRRALEPSPGSFSINLEFAFPTPLLDLWRFADPPDPAQPQLDGATVGPGSGPLDRAPATGSSGSGADVTIETPLETVATSAEAIDVGILGWLGTVLLAYAAVAAVVAAVYLGGIDRRLRDEPAAPFACVVRYAPRFLAYYLVSIGAFALLAVVLVATPPLLLLAIPGALVLGYLFYAVPFLFVVDDARFVEAFRRSYGVAIAGGPYLGFAVAHALVAAAASFVLSIAVSAGGAGTLFALAAAPPVALVLTAASASFLRELVATDAREATGGVSP